MTMIIMLTYALGVREPPFSLTNSIPKVCTPIGTLVKVKLLSADVMHCPGIAIIELPVGMGVGGLVAAGLTLGVVCIVAAGLTPTLAVAVAGTVGLRPAVGVIVGLIVAAGEAVGVACIIS
jgi:hypothetical protein